LAPKRWNAFREMTDGTLKVRKRRNAGVGSFSVTTSVVGVGAAVLLMKSKKPPKPGSVFSSRARSSENFASSAVTGLPSENCAARNVKV
jgi:hypothetical protein